MEKVPCFYTVVRYFQDPIRNEPRNIGVILQCQQRNYINCRFLLDLRSKLAHVASPLDMKVIKTYVGDFTNRFQPFTTRTAPLFKDLQPYLEQTYLFDLFKENLGKLQFSEPRGTLADDPEQELEYLFRTFVKGAEEHEVEKLKRSRLKTDLKMELKERRLLLLKKAKVRVGFEPDAKVRSKYSEVEHRVDFAMHNGELSVLETVDMRRKNKKEIEHETLSAAFKHYDLSRDYNGNGYEGYSIIALPDEQESVEGFNYYLKVLNAYSKVIVYTDLKEKERFIEKLQLIAQH